MVKRLGDNACDSPLVLEEISDPVEVKSASEQHRRFQSNLDWFCSHADQIYRQHRGKFVCVSREQIFVASTAEEALNEAVAVNPDDIGRFVMFIPQHVSPRVYSC